MRWFAGADHAGFGLKRHLIDLLRGMGDEVIDLGTDSEQSVDYPDYGAAVGRAVASARTPTLGLVICGTGIGISIAANKIPGVRAAVCTEAFAATAARAHNDANVLALGARVIGAGVAESCLRAFRDTQFEGGRHARRVAKLATLDDSTRPDGDKS
ncbi:MAG TPA: ribose 5-phosphate isomerase B [Kofleriaceae bacterium]|nr:ribose 5-phosphate isomerase B [Kofleriaceae bacterium]